MRTWCCRSDTFSESGLVQIFCSTQRRTTAVALSPYQFNKKLTKFRRRRRAMLGLYKPMVERWKNLQKLPYHRRWIL